MHKRGVQPGILVGIAALVAGCMAPTGKPDRAPGPGPSSGKADTRAAAPCDPESTSDDSWQRARVNASLNDRASNATVHATGGIQGPDDADWYRVPVTDAMSFSLREPAALRARILLGTTDDDVASPWKIDLAYVCDVGHATHECAEGSAQQTAGLGPACRSRVGDVVGGSKAEQAWLRIDCPDEDKSGEAYVRVTSSRHWQTCQGYELKMTLDNH
jgi:hypothetical protein